MTYAVPVPNRPLVLGATFTELFLLAAHGVKWCDGRVAMDGITISDVTSHRVTGYAPAYDGDIPFRARSRDHATDRRISAQAAASLKRPQNNAMQLTRSACERPERPLQLIAVFCGPGGIAEP